MSLMTQRSNLDAASIGVMSSGMAAELRWIVN
jgi:hypothetical protein